MTTNDLEYIKKTLGRMIDGHYQVMCALHELQRYLQDEDDAH